MRKRVAVISIVVLVTAGASGIYLLGRLWRARCIEKRINRYSESIWKHAEANALPTELVRAVIRAESSGNARAVSRRGAKGLMQVTRVAESDVLQQIELPRGDLFDPGYNILIGTMYLRQLINLFDGDLYLALAGYHAGPTKILEIYRTGDTRPGKEIVSEHAPRTTRAYCHLILAGKPSRLPPAKSHP